MLNQCPLVLESVTLTEMVKLVVEVLVDLSAGTILHKKTSENSESSHPHDLAERTLSALLVTSLDPMPLYLLNLHRDKSCIPWHTSIRCTLSLTETTMSTDSSSSLEVSGTRSRVHGDRFADNEAISNELPDCLAGIGIADFIRLVGVQPSKASESLLCR
jgi:hypothetical protein